MTNLTAQLYKASRDCSVGRIYQQHRFEYLFDCAAQEIEFLRESLHASAPDGYKCADCEIDQEPCPACYAVWWQQGHPNTVMIESATASDSPEDMCDESGCTHAADCTVHKIGTWVCNCGDPAELMTKAEIIYRRQEAFRMLYPPMVLEPGMIICDEAGEVTPEMWNRWATIDRHQLLNSARRAEKGQVQK